MTVGNVDMRFMIFSYTDLEAQNGWFPVSMPVRSSSRSPILCVNSNTASSYSWPGSRLGYLHCSTCRMALFATSLSHGNPSFTFLRDNGSFQDQGLRPGFQFLQALDLDIHNPEDGILMLALHRSHSPVPSLLLLFDRHGLALNTHDPNATLK